RILRQELPDHHPAIVARPEILRILVLAHDDRELHGERYREDESTHRRLALDGDPVEQGKNADRNEDDEEPILEVVTADVEPIREPQNGEEEAERQPLEGPARVAEEIANESRSGE